MSARPRRVPLAGLEAVEVPSADPRALCVLCLHGYGADMGDLLPLAADLPVSRPLRWVFPNAPIALPWGGRAWFPIDAAALESAMSGGRPRDLSAGEPAGMDAARGALRAALSALGARPEELVLMGFSQGSMMALDLALGAPSAAVGVAVLSGALVDRPRLERLAPGKAGQRFFQSHGSADPILAFSQALALEKALRAAGWEGRLRRFEGGHGIPPEVGEELGAWLDGL